MPIAITSSRPSSTTTVPNTTNGAPRPTATSRRGGRTRSRSPPVMGGRMTGNGEPYQPTSGENPSSVAAAAAATAKALTSSGPREEPGAYRGAYSAPWPDDGRGMYHHPHPHHHRYPGYGDPYLGGPYDRSGYPLERSYRDSRHYDEYARGQPSRGQYPPDYRYSHARDAPRGHPNGNSRSGTSLVIGGTTPIHLPKTVDSSSDSHRGSAASVFRGRPGDKAEGGSSSPGELDEDSPQKILLSLRTPTTSFDDKDKDKKAEALSLSPGIGTNNTRPAELFNADDKNNGFIENAPSFNLLNQSFDSFGDGHFFNVDGSLQADSFGMGRTASIDPDAAAQILRSASGGTFSQQLLASGSGALNIGYSPVNSFGNISSSGSRRGGTMMVVGGPADARSGSPTQVLNVYRSYSGAGSFGGPSMSHVRSYGESFGSPNPYYSTAPGPEGNDKDPHFYAFLRRHRLAFKDLTFLLPGLKSALLADPMTSDEVDISSNDDRTGNQPLGMFDPSPQDCATAKRRVECSVFAFGGNPNHRGGKDDTESKSSIFRDRPRVDKQELVTVTPTSTISAVNSRKLSKYEDALPSRYYENESRLSWEFEEMPPVEISRDDDSDSDKGDNDSSSKKHSDDSKQSSKLDMEASHNKSGGDSDSSGKRPGSSPQPKMRYRCKLCGQPKQNHTCPYQQSLARSIGIMVFPAVNAFAANEPGTVAPPLMEMNNFIDARDNMSSNESSPNRPTPDRLRLPPSSTVAVTTQVTPDSLRSSTRHTPPMFVSTAPGRHSRRGGPNRKRSYGHMREEQSDLLFIESMELKPEQFRFVTSYKWLKSTDAFVYPSLPLPYAQRKRLSDNLFSLSNEVTGLTDECAQVLREAREKDLWDLAVAELMTQVIVIIHCPEGDHRFEGLRQYLLTLGIAC